ncbi:MAG: glycoside hydrolase family 18 protein [Myxococcota bacterium]|nr:glycoside hydrolase family 18 protein [Myxococcota bacterium]
MGQWVMALLAGAAAAPADQLAESADSYSVHLEHAELQLGRLSESERSDRVLQRPGDPPEAWVYGYLPYWANNLNTVAWDSLTHVAVFDVGVDSNANLTRTSNWTGTAEKVLRKADKYGVRVHLTLTCFDAQVMEAVLNQPAKRSRLAESVAELVNDYGGHGVSVDFEGVPYSVKQTLVAFVQELSLLVEEVTVATPAVDWNSSFDYDELAAASDALFIMGYGYHWKGGDPGPVSPLFGGGVWSKYSLQWSVEDHMKWGAPADRILLGLPLYGRSWPSTSKEVPGVATADGEAVVYEVAVPAADSLGRHYDEQTETPYAFPSSREQLWYDDIESIRAKIAYAIEEDLLGVGFWALNYDGGDEALWEMVRQETGAGGVATPDSGQGDTGSWSEGGDSGGPQGSDKAEEAGCAGCATASGGSSSAGFGLLGLLLVGWSRRRKDSRAG